MLRDMYSDKNGRVQYPEEKISRMAHEVLSRFRTKTMSDRQVVTWGSFLNGIGSHAFRGTSALCRSKRNVFANISRRIAARAIKTNVAKGKLSGVITKKNYQGSCQSCKARTYKVASHMTIITPEGYSSEK